jgi:hypothetical protein
MLAGVGMVLGGTTVPRRWVGRSHGSGSLMSTGRTWGLVTSWRPSANLARSWCPLLPLPGRRSCRRSPRSQTRLRRVAWTWVWGWQQPRWRRRSRARVMMCAVMPCLWVRVAVALVALTGCCRPRQWSVRACRWGQL